MPSTWGAKKRGVMPYNFQHVYFFFTFPPLLLPLYFHYENILFAIKKKSYVDVLCTLLFFAKHFYLFGPLMGYLGAFAFYMLVRFLESHWFVWVTQMNHIPMEVEKEQNRDWVSMQLAATCNVEGSFFNDWFTGCFYIIRKLISDIVFSLGVRKIQQFCSFDDRSREQS